MDWSPTYVEWDAIDECTRAGCRGLFIRILISELHGFLGRLGFLVVFFFICFLQAVLVLQLAYLAIAFVCKGLPVVLFIRILIVGLHELDYIATQGGTLPVVIFIRIWIHC